MDFIPETKDKLVKVPYFDDVTSDGGWQGHATTKSIDGLKSEVNESIGRLGGIVIKIQMGSFVTEGQGRQGMRIEYMMDGTIPGRLDIAALPVRISNATIKTLEKRKQQSMKMALYMLRMALDGMWFLQQLSPGYAALLPWMLVDKNTTFSQKWAETNLAELMPSNDSEFVDGVITVLEK
jgi:hypothetical protein